MAEPRQRPAAMLDDSPQWPEQVFAKLREADIRQVTYVPDSGHARLIQLCHADPGLKTTVLTTEEEGIGVLSGAWLGGERGVLLMQSSGVGNCINTLSLATVCGFPLLMLVTMRGEWGEFNPWQVPMGQITASALRLCGVIVHEVTTAELAAPTVEAAGRIAFNSNRAVAVLLSQQMLGTKLFKD
ncbi:MAG: thiamine pyrophosphate-binding protein [Xanthobacteraceae bacterium]